MSQQPFEVRFEEVQANLDHYVDVVFASLESDFLTMPKGSGFIEYPTFEMGYEALKSVTDGFSTFNAEAVCSAIMQCPMIFIVLRTMLGFTPPEWAYMTSSQTDVTVSQGHARTLDRNIRLSPATTLNCEPEMLKRLKAMVDTACALLQRGAPECAADRLHRLDKADTKYGLSGVQNLSSMGAPYAVLLYERFLGRPFAGHRDSVSDLIGDGLESAIEEVLTKAKVSFRKTKRAERIPDFDQTPDFILPSEFNPQIVIEAKITEDDGTARDKVTRIQHLAELSRQHELKKGKGFQVIACIGGRGFGVRREDMKKLLIATSGCVFTPKTIQKLIDVVQKGVNL